MPKLSGRRIITNRQLNFTLSPVDKHNPKEMPYKLSNFEIDGTWNQHQSIILDILLDFMIKKLYSKYPHFPRSWRSDKVINEDKSFFYSMFSPEAMESLSKGPLYTFFSGSNKNTLERERECYDKDLDAKERFTFEQYLEDYLKHNFKYQMFVEEYEKNIAVIDNSFKVNLSIDEIFKSYEILKKYKYKFREHLDKIGNTFFKMNYKVKCIEKAPENDSKGRQLNKGSLVSKQYEMNEFENIFQAVFNDNRLTLDFKSPLGKMILHNTIVLDTDWIEEEALELKKNAYFIYKNFILNRVAGNNKATEIVLWYEDIKAFLDLKWGNNSGNYAIINRAFDEMQSKGLIEGYKWNRDYAAQRQYRIIRALEKKKKEIDKVLKF